jgi:hypothetical protein
MSEGLEPDIHCGGTFLNIFNDFAMGIALQCNFQLT